MSVFFFFGFFGRVPQLGENDGWVVDDDALMKTLKRWVGGFETFLGFHPYLGKIPNLTDMVSNMFYVSPISPRNLGNDDSHFDEHIFSRWVGSTTN